MQKRMNKHPALYFGDMDIFGAPMTPIGIPFHTPLILKKNILAAIATYDLGYKSMDYVLKKYGAMWDFDEVSKERKNLNKYIGLIHKEIEEIAEQYSNGVKRPEIIGIMAAETTMLRLVASFISSSLLIKMRFTFEAIAICRLIIEQIAWAFGVHKLNNVDEVLTLKATKCISKLKNSISYVGRFYGELSRYTHINPDVHARYLETKDDKIHVTYPNREDIYTSVYYLLITTDIYRIVSEFISYDFFNIKNSCIKDDENGITIFDERPFNSIVDEFEIRFRKELVN